MTSATTRGIEAEQVIQLKAHFPAPPQRVFRALTEPQDMQVWIWGGIGKDPQASVDLRPGGRYSASVRVGDQPDWPRARWAMMGMYIEVAPPHRLVYTVHWDAPVGYNQGGKVAIDEVVTIELAAKDDGTELSYLHRGIPTIDGAEGHRKGILHTFKMLREQLEREG
jgi:uncharacterized protein YndB with AHSA1/START domain